MSVSPYQAHKQKRFRSADNPHIAANAAFSLREPDTRQLYNQAYEETAALYYQEQPTFSDILSV